MWKRRRRWRRRSFAQTLQCEPLVFSVAAAPSAAAYSIVVVVDGARERTVGGTDDRQRCSLFDLESNARWSTTETLGPADISIL